MAGRRSLRRSAGCWGWRHDRPFALASARLDALAASYRRADGALRRDPDPVSPRRRRHGGHLVEQLDLNPLPADGADDRLAGGAAAAAIEDAGAGVAVAGTRLARRDRKSRRLNPSH